MKKFAMILGPLLFIASFCVFVEAPAAPAKTLQEIHGAKWPKSVGGNVTKYPCMRCQGDYKKLGAQIADLAPNPNKSHLRAVNCEDCHTANLSQPVLMCNECLNFTIKKKQK